MYVFLDVDGVLNTEADWERKLYSLNPHARSHGTTINETWQTGDVDIVSAGDILISTAKIELILGL